MTEFREEDTMMSSSPPQVRHVCNVCGTTDRLPDGFCGRCQTNSEYEESLRIDRERVGNDIRIDIFKRE